MNLSILTLHIFKRNASGSGEATNKCVYINSNCIESMIHYTDAETRIRTISGEEYDVVQTPDEIIQMIIL